MDTKTDNQANPSRDELRQRVLAELAEFQAGRTPQPQSSEETEPETQPRDEKGRFVAKEQANEAPEQAPEQPKRKQFYKKIEVDGIVQEFEADTIEEYIAKFEKAQEHATRKISELSKRTKEMAKTTPKPQPKKFEPKKLTVEEQFLVRQKFEDDPAAAMEELLQATVGASAEAIREALQQNEAAKEQLRVAQEIEKFRAANADFVEAYPTNSVKIQTAMEKFIADNNLVVTKENLELAWEEVKGNEELSVPESTKHESAATPTRKRASVGLTSRQASHVDDDMSENTPDVDEYEKLNKLSKDELRNRIVAEQYKAAHRALR